MIARLLLPVVLWLFTGEMLYSQDLVVFTTTGCPYCQQAREFLEAAAAEHPDFRFEEENLSEDPEAVVLFGAMIERHGIDRPSVPLIVIGDHAIVGFREPETPQLIAGLLGWQPLDSVAGRGDSTALFPEWLSIERYGLPAFTFMLGLIDGFNPCAMWVLLFLLSMLVHVKSRKRMFLIAGIFVLASGAVYYLFMAAWLNLFLAFRWSTALRVFIGLLGVTAALFHLKDFFLNLKGPSLSISEEKKSRIGARIRAVITAKNLPPAIAAVTVLAVLVNFYELLCTAGLPALYTQILAQQEVEGARFYGLLLLYNLAYILDDGLMVFSATWALSSQRLRPTGGRLLKGLSGLVLLILSLLLIFRPQTLSFS